MAAHLDELNPAQRAAVEHGITTGGDAARTRPLLIIAGAGTGKTKTLAHRVAHLILHGADPGRVLLLTFTRRAAQEMTRRARRIVARACSGARSLPASRTGRGIAGDEAGRILWAGTFHSIANRLLRLYAQSVGLAPSFTVLDRSDAADLMNLLRDELGFSRKATRFPKKDTCVAIYSLVVNARRSLETVLAEAFPWCSPWTEELRALFGAYVQGKQERNVLDYDDLLLYWHQMMAESGLAAVVGARFGHVLVDEYQDTNTLQATILLALKPDGGGLTVVGDDAQSIYSFRGATARNILDFPGQFDPPATVITLAQNYRSTQRILAACNAVIQLSTECFPKNLFSSRRGAQGPLLVTAEDETCQVEYVVERILENREAGIELRRQAVLFRAAHHSDQLEVDLARRNIPFVKYGGLKFIEAAHVKDVLCVLRWAENPRDAVAAFRVLQILPGMGPRYARAAIEHVRNHHFELAALRSFSPPSAAGHDWPDLCVLLHHLVNPGTNWAGQITLVRQWYQPHLERLYDSAAMRARDIEELEQIAAAYPSRERFLTELTLDPPDASSGAVGDPHLDEDFLILSTIHSAKGQEWDVVYVLNVTDGCVPSDMATGRPEQIEEERRLLYVAMTRAREQLHLIHPLRFFKREQHPYGDRHVYAPRSRFIRDAILDQFERCTHGRLHTGDSPDQLDKAVRIDAGARLREMWSG